MQSNNMYAYGGTNEMIECNKIAQAAKMLLRDVDLMLRKRLRDNLLYKVLRRVTHGIQIYIFQSTQMLLMVKLLAVL